MRPGNPTLYVFAISHYCEKARWALDHLGIRYTLRHLAPGEHRLVARKLGARHGHVPYLLDGEVLVQGSANIIDWADENRSPGSERLTPEQHAEACRAIERRIDDIAGVHVRRYYYSEALIDYPDTVLPVFVAHLALPKRLMTRMGWGQIRQLMIKGMDLGASQGQASREIVEKELDWLDGLLADGREYLVPDRFTRADLAVASLLSPLAQPPEHPIYNDLSLPPGISRDVAAWQDRPALQWVRAVYARHRHTVVPHEAVPA